MSGGSEKEIRQRQIDLRTIVEGPQPGERSQLTTRVDAVRCRLMTDTIRLHQIVDHTVQVCARGESKVGHVLPGIVVVQWNDFRLHLAM